MRPFPVSVSRAERREFMNQIAPNMKKIAFTMTEYESGSNFITCGEHKIPLSKFRKKKLITDETVDILPLLFLAYLRRLKSTDEQLNKTFRSDKRTIGVNQSALIKAVALQLNYSGEIDGTADTELDNLVLKRLLQIQKGYNEGKVKRDFIRFLEYFKVLDETILNDKIFAYAYCLMHDDEDYMTYLIVRLFESIGGIMASGRSTNKYSKSNKNEEDSLEEDSVLDHINWGANYKELDKSWPKILEYILEDKNSKKTDSKNVTENTKNNTDTQSEDTVDSDTQSEDKVEAEDIANNLEVEDGIDKQTVMGIAELLAHLLNENNKNDSSNDNNDNSIIAVSLNEMMPGGIDIEPIVDILDDMLAIEICSYWERDLRSPSYADVTKSISDLFESGIFKSAMSFHSLWYAYFSGSLGMSDFLRFAQVELKCGISTEKANKILSSKSNHARQLGILLSCLKDCEKEDLLSIIDSCENRTALTVDNAIRSMTSGNPDSLLNLISSYSDIQKEIELLIQRHNNKLTTIKESNSNEVKKYKETISRLKSQLSNEKESKSHTEKISQYQNQIDQLKSGIDGLNSEIRRITKELEMTKMNNFKNESKAVGLGEMLEKVKKSFEVAGMSLEDIIEEDNSYTDGVDATRVYSDSDNDNESTKVLSTADKVKALKDLGLSIAICGYQKQIYSALKDRGLNVSHVENSGDIKKKTKYDMYIICADYTAHTHVWAICKQAKQYKSIVVLVSGSNTDRFINAIYKEAVE